MYIVRNIFQLHFGHFKEAKALLDEALKNRLMPNATSVRILSDFTGNSYPLIFEEGYDSLTEYERTLVGSMATKDWQKWYEKFKEHVASSHRIAKY